MQTWMLFLSRLKNCLIRALKGKAVVVGGSPDQRGVVCAASYEARKFGVHSAMPLVTAKQLVPARHLSLRPSRQVRGVFPQGGAAFSSASRRLLKWYRLMRPISTSPARARLHGDPLPLAHRLRSEVEQQTGLSVSIGISRTKLVSKVASDLAKPRGILWVLPGHEAALLAPLTSRQIAGHREGHREAASRS